MDLLILELEWGQRNSMDNFLIHDGTGKQVSINEKDFDFVQNDAKIHDLKLKSKPTTYFKDSLKRFFKSKSSVVGGVIVGALLLFAFIVPLCTPEEGVYNTANGAGGTPAETFLPPKLFPSGTGFWDGTLKRNDILFDNETKTPVSYTEGTYFDLKTYDKIVDNVTSEYGEGGFVNVFCSSHNLDANFYSLPIDFYTNLDYSLEISFDSVEKSGYEFVGYKLSLYDGTNKYYLIGSESEFSKEEHVTINNVFEELKAENYSFGENLNARLYFEVSKSNNLIGFMPLKSVEIKSNSDDTEYNNVLSLISFKDGNSVMLRENTSIGYWTGDFGKVANNVKLTYCSFTYDKYEDVYGKRQIELGSREILVYEINGSLQVNFATTGLNATSDKEVLKERFKILNDDCPIVEVVEQVGNATYNSVTGRYSNFTLKVIVYNYRMLGYKSMPFFVFGTNKTGQDYFKLLFTGLRFSFFLAIGVSIVNIAIGLIWGSISGYFGGWTDILMERFCDIISGLPLTVIITLCILYGQEYNWGSGSSDVIALMLALFMTGWMGVAHQTRTQFYRFKGREYVLASRTLGAKDSRLIFKHILPNAAGTIITGSVLIIPGVIYTEASIAYLGLGLKNKTLFGVLLSQANAYYQGENSFLLFIPTFIMMLLLISFNLFGNGLRDAFNPQLKGSE